MDEIKNYLKQNLKLKRKERKEKVEMPGFFGYGKPFYKPVISVSLELDGEEISEIDIAENYSGGMDEIDGVK